MTDPRLLWWIDRSAGLLALVLLTLVVVLGLLSAGRSRKPQMWRAAVQGLHRQLPLTATVLLAVHVGTAVTDSYVPLRPLDAVVPFASAYRPVWIGFGTLAVDIVLTLVVSGLLRSRIRPRAWRAVHKLAYLLWPLAALHAIGNGTDVRAQTVQRIGLACIAAVVIAAGARVVEAVR